MTQVVTAKVVAWVVSDLKFLAFGPLKAIVALAISKIVGKVLEITLLGAAMGAIKAKANSDLHEVERVIREVLEYEGELTDEVIKAFDDKLAEAGIKLIRFESIE